MTSPIIKPEYSILSENTVIRGQKICSKNFEKDKRSISKDKKVISLHIDKTLSSSKNKTPSEDKFLLISSSNATRRTITAYQNTLKTYARWASPVNKALKQL